MSEMGWGGNRKWTIGLSLLAEAKEGGEVVKSYRDLIVWQKAVGLVADLYAATRHFPADEVYGITSQLRRAAISIPSNIAEGFGRNSKPDFGRHLNIAIGSLYELQTQLEIAHRLSYLGKASFDDLYGLTRELEAMLRSLLKSLKAKS